MLDLCACYMHARLNQFFGAISRLAMAGVMSAMQGKSVVWFGLLCSSFTRMNVGTSRRSYLVPLGNTHRKSVLDSNCLAARTLCALSRIRSGTLGKGVHSNHL